MPKTNFSLVPNFQADTFALDELENLTHVLQKFSVHGVKFTSTRRLALAGPTKEERAQISSELQHISIPRKNNWITSIQACPGKSWCKHGIRDSTALAERVESIEFDFTPKGRIKIGIAGCKRCCTEPYIRDIGVVPDRIGWTLTFGGNGGGKPRIGDIIARGLTNKQAIELIRNCLTVYQENAESKMRTARFIESFGLQQFARLVGTMPLTGTERTEKSSNA